MTERVVIHVSAKKFAVYKAKMREWCSRRGSESDEPNYDTLLDAERAKFFGLRDWPCEGVKLVVKKRKRTRRNVMSTADEEAIKTELERDYGLKFS